MTQNHCAFGKMVGSTPSTQHIAKLTTHNGTSWLVDIELLAQVHKFADLLLFRGTDRKAGWLTRAVKRSTAYDESPRTSARPTVLPVEEFSSSFMQAVDIDAHARQAGSSATELRPLGGVGAGGSGGDSPSSRATRPQPGESGEKDEGVGSGLKATTRSDTADATAVATEFEEEFLALVSKLMRTDPTRAANLLLAGNPQTPVPKAKDSNEERRAQLSAIMKSCMSPSMLPRFLAFDDPQEIYDEVVGWEIDKRSNTLPLIKAKLAALQMSSAEIPQDFFTRAKLLFTDLDTAGDCYTEYTAVSLMLAAVVHDRFSPLKTMYVKVLPDALRFEDVVSDFNRVEMQNMNLPKDHPNYPPYLNLTKSPAPAYATHVFPPAGGRGTGAARGRGGRGGGRGGRGNGGVAGGGGGPLLCTHCQKSGHLVATCYQLHPHLAPSSSRPKPAQHAPTVAEYNALIAQMARFQGH